MQQLLQHLDNYHSLSADAIAALSEKLEPISLSKNDFLLKKGKVCRHLYFLESGALRGYYDIADREVTHWFGFENTFVTSFHSYSTGAASIENIQLLEDATLWAISKHELSLLFDRYHEIERLVRIIYERYYMLLEERYVNAQFKTAAERYADLITNAPHILNRVPLGYISSYLGITQETLSRVRRQHAQF